MSGKRSEGTSIRGRAPATLSRVHRRRSLLAIAPDDAVLFYSDGLWDAESARREPFEEARLDAAWARCTDGGSCPPVDQVMAAVRDHRGTKAQVDDETALVIWPRHG